MAYSLGETLRKQRDLKGMSQMELAEKTGITKAHIARIELGQIVEPKRDMLERIAQGLGISIRELADPAWYEDEDPWTTMRRLLSENRRMSIGEKRAFQVLLEPWFKKGR